MGHHSAPSEGPRHRGKTLLLGAAGVGALTVIALGSAGTASASCVSFSGINSGSGPGKCQTTTIGDTAIGIGDTDYVRASGGFNTSIAIGNGSGAWTAPLSPGQANVGNFNLAVGTNSLAESSGVGNSAVVLGNNSIAASVGTLNRAIILGNNDNNGGYAGAYAHGVLNNATVIGNNSYAFAYGGKPADNAGGGNTAVTVGNNSGSEAHGTLRLAAALGNNKFAHNGINNH